MNSSQSKQSQENGNIHVIGLHWVIKTHLIFRLFMKCMKGHVDPILFLKEPGKSHIFVLGLIALDYQWNHQKY